MSCTGMPSVIQTIKAISASIAAIIASAACGAGTKIILTSAPVCALASFTVSKTGTPR